MMNCFCGKRNRMAVRTAAILAVSLLSSCLSVLLPAPEAYGKPKEGMTYKEYVDAGNTIPESTLFVGTYLMDAEGLGLGNNNDAGADSKGSAADKVAQKAGISPLIYQKAKESQLAYSQKVAFYRSELAGGHWRDILEAEGLPSILSEAPEVTSDTLNPLLITCVVGADGVPRDPESGDPENIFNRPSPYEMEDIPELLPVQEYFDSGELTRHSSGADNYLYWRLYYFFEHDNMEFVRERINPVNANVSFHKLNEDSTGRNLEFIWDEAEVRNQLSAGEDSKIGSGGNTDFMAMVRNWPNVRDKKTDQDDAAIDTTYQLYLSLSGEKLKSVSANDKKPDEAEQAMEISKILDSDRRARVFYNMLKNPDIMKGAQTDEIDDVIFDMEADIEAYRSDINQINSVEIPDLEDRKKALEEEKEEAAGLLAKIEAGTLRAEESAGEEGTSTVTPEAAKGYKELGRYVYLKWSYENKLASLEPEIARLKAENEEPSAIVSAFDTLETIPDQLRAAMDSKSWRGDVKEKIERYSADAAELREMLSQAERDRQYNRYAVIRSHLEDVEELEKEYRQESADIEEEVRTYEGNAEKLYQQVSAVAEKYPEKGGKLTELSDELKGIYAGIDEKMSSGISDPDMEEKDYEAFNDKCEEAVKEIRDEYEKAKAVIDSKQKEADEAKALRDKMNVSISERSASIEEELKLIDELIEAKKDRIKYREEQIELKNAGTEAKKAEKEAFETGRMMDATKAGYEAKIQELKIEGGELAIERKKLDEEWSQLKSDENDLKIKKTTMESDLAARKAEKAELDSRFADLGAEIPAITARIEGAAKQREDRIKAAETDLGLEHLRSLIKTTEEGIESSKASIAKARKTDYLDYKTKVDLSLIAEKEAVYLAARQKQNFYSQIVSELEKAYNGRGVFAMIFLSYEAARVVNNYKVLKGKVDVEVNNALQDLRKAQSDYDAASGKLAGWMKVGHKNYIDKVARARVDAKIKAVCSELMAKVSSDTNNRLNWFGMDFSGYSGSGGTIIEQIYRKYLELRDYTDDTLKAAEDAAAADLTKLEAQVGDSSAFNPYGPTEEAIVKHIEELTATLEGYNEDLEKRTEQFNRRADAINKEMDEKDSKLKAELEAAENKLRDDQKALQVLIDAKQLEIDSLEKEIELENFGQRMENLASREELCKEKMKLAERKIADNEAQVRAVTEAMADLEKEIENYVPGTDFAIGPTLLFLQSLANEGKSNEGRVYANMEPYREGSGVFTPREKLTAALESSIASSEASFVKYREEGLTRGETVCDNERYRYRKEVIAAGLDMEKALPYLEHLVDLDRIQEGESKNADREIALIDEVLIPESLVRIDSVYRDRNAMSEEDLERDVDEYQTFIMARVNAMKVSDSRMYVEQRIKYAQRLQSGGKQWSASIISAHIAWLKNLLDSLVTDDDDTTGSLLDDLIKIKDEIEEEKKDAEEEDDVNKKNKLDELGEEIDKKIEDTIADVIGNLDPKTADVTEVIHKLDELGGKAAVDEQIRNIIDNKLDDGDTDIGKELDILEKTGGDIAPVIDTLIEKDAPQDVIDKARESEEISKESPLYEKKESDDGNGSDGSGGGEGEGSQDVTGNRDDETSTGDNGSGDSGTGPEGSGGGAGDGTGEGGFEKGDTGERDTGEGGGYDGGDLPRPEDDSERPAGSGSKRKKGDKEGRDRTKGVGLDRSSLKGSQIGDAVKDALGKDISELDTPEKAETMAALTRYAEVYGDEAVLAYVTSMISSFAGQDTQGFIYQQYGPDRDNRYVSLEAINQTRRYTKFRCVADGEKGRFTLSQLAGGTNRYTISPGSDIAVKNGDGEDKMVLPAVSGTDRYLDRSAAKVFGYISEEDCRKYTNCGCQYVRGTDYAILIPPQFEKMIQRIIDSLTDAALYM